MATLFTNRSLCYLKLQKWDSATQDARRAIDLENNSVKGHFFIGHALLEQGYDDEAIAHLKKAAECAKTQKLNYGDDIWNLIRKSKKIRWNKLEEKRMSQEIELQSYLTKAIKLFESKSSEDQSIVSFETEKRIEEVDRLFFHLDDRRKKRDVPDYLCCRISFEIMKDPVVTPSGITYDRPYIEEHLQRVGHFDPVTRTELTTAQLIPNLSMHEVINSFISENEWVDDY